MLQHGEFRFRLGYHRAVNDSSVEWWPVTLSDFITSAPHSPYTTFVSAGNASKVFQLDFHCNRLIESLQALNSASSSPSAQDLRVQLKALISWISKNLVIPRDSEIQFVVILSGTGSETCLRVHATPFQSSHSDQIQTTPIAVECRIGQRSTPAVKDTSWYTERKSLENVRSKNANETILVAEFDTDHPVLLEGLITNFFVVTRDLEVWTAGDQLVLSGSIKRLVLQACKDLGVTVVEKAVPLRSWSLYEAAFLTNARRLLQPVRAIEVPAVVRGRLHDIPAVVAFQERCEAVDLVESLRRRVAMIIETTAERIDE